MGVDGIASIGKSSGAIRRSWRSLLVCHVVELLLLLLLQFFVGRLIGRTRRGQWRGFIKGILLDVGESPAVAFQ